MSLSVLASTAGHNEECGEQEAGSRVPPVEGRGPQAGGTRGVLH